MSLNESFVGDGSSTWLGELRHEGGDVLQPVTAELAAERDAFDAEALVAKSSAAPATTLTLAARANAFRVFPERHEG